jgi:hypothetical protein
VPTNFDAPLNLPYEIKRDLSGVIIGSGSPIGIRSAEVFTGVSRRKPKGWVAPTNYSLFYRYYKLPQGTLKQYHVPPQSTDVTAKGNVGAIVTLDGQLQFNELLTEPNMYFPSLANSALIKARNQLKGTNINLGVAFAERNATARLLGDTAINIAKSFTYLKKGHVRKAMNQLGISSKSHQPRGSNVPRQWLQLQYGWKPLLSDVYGACEALSKRNKGDWRVTAKGRVSQERSFKFTWTGFRSGTGEAKVMNGAFCRIDALPRNELLISLASIGVTNPLLIGWELVPFSFVVDWALPIGGWLESLDALLGYESAYTSTTQLVRAEWHTRGGSGSESGYLVKNDYTGEKRVVVLTRVASSGVPLPQFPRIKNPASLGHMANGLSLLAAAFKTRR